MSNVKMTHPDAKGSIEVRPDFVDMYKSQGWVEKEAPKSSDKPGDKS